jgi:Anti-sigma-K factor rskA
MKPDFDELVGTDLAPEERERLLRAHELLIAAGPPPELPPSLAAPEVPEGEVETPFFNRRRNAVLALLAAALAAAGFGAGYLFGDSKQSDQFAQAKTVVMRGTPVAPAGAVASIALADKDEAGNWQMLVRVSNLNKLPKGQYYTLWLTKKHKAVAPCGSFLVHDKTTEVRFTVAYNQKRYDGWVVTLQTRGDRTPGRVLLTTV